MRPGATWPSVSADGGVATWLVREGGRPRIYGSGLISSTASSFEISPSSTMSTAAFSAALNRRRRSSR